ncbi:MAG: hypothetical protein QOH40_699 [Arthrobacter pascens]|nr:hypothetical protein [Arthrobacter pascens]
MKKLLLLGLPAIAIAGLQVWSQALAEPAPVHIPGIVVPNVPGASPATRHSAFDDDGVGLRERQEDAASLTGADNRGGRDAR